MRFMFFFIRSLIFVFLWQKENVVNVLKKEEEKLIILDFSVQIVGFCDLVFLEYIFRNRVGEKKGLGEYRKKCRRVIRV